MRGLCVLVLSGMGFAASAQDADFGVRYWYSQATTTRSHNAQGVVPFLGNPTSVLTYEDVNAHAAELHGRRDVGRGWFVRGIAGLGWITSGSFDDEDFFVGQVKFSDSTSPVKGNKLHYASLDFGRELWQFRDGSAGLFIGYHHWSERLDAYGAVFTVGGGAPIPESQPVISNEVTWRSLRLGLSSVARLSSTTRLMLDAVLLPYAKVRDEDSHWLRTDPADLGPAPNILIEGRGRGLQLELELRHLVGRAWELGAGARHWWLRSRRGSREAVGTSVPLVELESQRTGLTLSLTRRW